MPARLSVFAVDVSGRSHDRKGTLRSVPPLYTLPRPTGLLSPYESHAWRFYAPSPTGLASIGWDRKLPDGSRLTDPANESFLESAKRFLTILIENPAQWFTLSKTSTALHRTYIFLNFIEWAVRLGYRSLSEVKWTDWVNFRQMLPKGVRAAAGDLSQANEEDLTDSRILDVFRVAQCIYLFRNELVDGQQLVRDGFSFAPFEVGEDPREMARSLGVRQGQTPSIPPPIALHCLDAAIQYVFLYADDIIDLNKRVREESTKQRKVRRAPGGFLKDVKRRLIEHLRGERLLLLTSDRTVVRSVLARQLSAQPSMISGTAVSQVLSEFESALNMPGPAMRTALLRRLEREIGGIEGAPRTSSVRNMASRIGLPFWGKKGSAAPWPISSVGSSAWMEGITLERATANLWTAIYIVIETMMADRLGESLSARVGCTHKGLDGSYMITRTFKPTNAAAGIENSRPCPEIVVRAIDVATRLGAAARQELDTDLLFASEHRLGASVLDETTIRKRLNVFASDVGAPPNEDGDGDEWHLAPHQLRRFLATTWVWYYELGPGLDALRQHLRHTDINQTVRYAAGDMYSMVTEEQVALTANILERSAFEGLDIHGPFGKRWKRLAFQINVKFVDHEQLEERVRRLVTSRKMLLHPNPWGYCVWSRRAGANAKCLALEDRHQDAKRPDNRKHAEVCAGCVNCAITKVFASFWAESKDRHESIAARKGIPEELREVACRGAAIANRVLLEMAAS
jgi:hypothetical protein